MIEFKQFIGGGMNSDDDPSFVESRDYIAAYNWILTGNTNGEEGIGTNLASTVAILGYTLPNGLNKCIGADKFDNDRKAYFFVYNSFNNHQLVEYDYDTNLNTLLFTNLIDSAGVDVLPLSPRNYIMDIKLVNGTLLIFTDSNMEVGYINIQRLKSGGYGVLKIDDFRLIKAQPIKLAQAKYGNDSGRVINLLKEKLFQYTSQFIYLDDEPSTYGSWSKRIVPERESTTSIGEDVTKNNNQTITVDIGTERVKDINIIARYSKYDWFNIKSVTRDYVLSLPNSTIDIPQEVYEAYDPTNNTYSFVFYNDGRYVNVAPTVTDLEYDRIPQKVQTLELLDSNVLTLGGITEGYNRPTVTVNISAPDYDPQLQGGSTQPDPLIVTNMYDTDPGYQHKRKIWVIFKGVARTGDTINALVRDFRNVSITKTYTYTVEPAYDLDTLGALQAMAVQMGNNGGPGGVGAVAFVNAPGQYALTWIDFPYFGYGYTTIDLVSVGSGQFASIHALKSNSAYQAAIQFYDRYGRTFPLVTGNEFIFKTNSYAQSKGLTPRMSWQISGTPPVGAVSYQWLLSENNTHQTTLYVNAKYLRTDGDYFVLSINPLKVFNERNSSSILNYEYSQGDRVTFMYYDDAGTKVYFDNPFIDVQVAGFNIDTTTSSPPVVTYELKVRRNASIVVSDITNKNIYIEIYTPKKRVVTEGSTSTYLTNLFYEVGERFDIINGQYSVTSGTITDGDVYFQTRDYVSAVDEVTYNTYLAEDFNFSALYESKYTSYGRGFLYNERDGITIRKAGIRYSDKYVIDSKLNMLNRFYAERLYGDGDGESSSIHGWIRKLRQRDNILICIQELKVGSIPVFNTIVEDQASQNQAFLSDKILNKIRYSQTGNIGMGNAKECYSESPNGTIYFIDPNNSVPMRYGYDGLTAIPKKKDKFFKGFLQAAKQAGRDIISIWDNYTRNNIISAQVREDDLVSVPMDENSFKYQEDYIIDPASITITTQMTKGVVTYNDNGWLITPTIGQTGADTFMYSFVVNGNTIIKKACVTIVPASQDPIPFMFNDVIDAELSTMYESNIVLISGITAPIPMSITGGEYSFDGVIWSSASVLVSNDTEVRVRRLSSSLYSTTVSVVLTTGSYSDSYDIKTKEDITPDPFSFAAITDAELSTQYVSELLTLSGVNVPVPISIVGGEYSVNGGAFTSVAGTISNGQTFQVRRTSSSAYVTEVTATLTISDTSAIFSITTRNLVTRYIWGRIFAENTTEVSTGIFAADIFLRSYIGSSNTTPPAAITANLYNCTNGAIAVSYHQTGSPSNDFNSSMSNESQVRLTAPGTEFQIGYPKQYVATPGVAYYYSFAGRAENEMVVLQTIVI